MDLRNIVTGISNGTFESTVDNAKALQLQIGVLNGRLTQFEANTATKQSEQMQVNVQAFRQLGARSGELGLRIGIENLADMFGPPDRKLIGSRPDELLELIDAIGLPNVGVTIDTSHANVQKLDIPAAIRAWGDRIYCTHISGNDGTGDQHLIPGHGRFRVIDWREVMRAFADIGYDGIINLEVPGGRVLDPQLLDHNTSHALAVTESLIAMANES